jgi:hypothetical protein
MAEAQPPSSSRSLTPADAPSPAAELMITLRPTELRATSHGIVPADQARTLVTTFGMVTSAIAGITGAVLTLSIDHGSTGVTLALAELALALVVAVLVAVVGRTRPTSRRRSP